jgi:hypothetical protein
MFAGSISMPWQMDISSLRKADSLRPPPFLIQAPGALPPNPRVPADELTYDEEPLRDDTHRR